MTQRAFVVLNPVAGTSDRDTVRQGLTKHLEAAQWHYDVYETTGEEKLDQVIQQAPVNDYDLFIAVGGDGTVSGVAGGLVHTHKPMAIVPTGTGNALARELNIPLALPEAWELAAHPQQCHAIDALEADKSFFFINVSMGISAAAMLKAKREAKRKFGWLAYLWAGLQQLAGIQPHHFAVHVDGQPHNVHASEVVVANTGIIGLQALRLAPDIRLDDGCLDVCVIRARTLKDYARVAWDVVRMRQHRDPHVRFFEAAEQVELYANTPVPLQADGEFLERTDRATITLVPHALNVIVPTAP